MAQKVNRGFIHDSISDMLTRIRNACLAKKLIVAVPFTRLNQQLAQILEREGFIQNYQLSFNLSEKPVEYKQNLETGVSHSGALQHADIIIRLKYRSKAVYKGKKTESCITNLKRISKPGLRIYANSKEIPRILGGTGIVIISTPIGIITDRDARLKGIGGELLCSVW